MTTAADAPTQEDASVASLRAALTTGPGSDAVVDLVAARLFGSLDLKAELGRFQLRGVIGSGGMGMVYAAHDPERDREVAIKVVRPSGVVEETPGIGQARLLREAEVLQRFDHPNVVRLLESGEHGDDVFLVMELIEGTTLGQWAAMAPRSWSEIVRVYVDAGEGLAAAHAMGIVHRDFKPANVLVGPDGRPRVVDFGLARPVDAEAFREAARARGEDDPPVDYSLTGTGLVTGTKGYMAPELFSGVKANPRTDLFAFCTSLLGALNRHAAEEGVPEVPDELNAVLVRGVAPDPEKRWQSLDALLAKLRGVLERSDPTRSRATARAGLGRWIVLATVGLLVLAAAVWWS